jgi:hypothetical protein
MNTHDDKGIVILAVACAAGLGLVALLQFLL